MGCKIRAARKLLGDLKENIQWETQEMHGRTRVILVIDKSLVIAFSWTLVNKFTLESSQMA